MWSKIKTGIGITIALLMLSSVTIFHPKDITENILMKLISLPEPQEIQPFLGHDRPLEEALRAVSADSISNTVKTLSSYTSRVVGYAGADSAYEYLKAEFEEIGLEDIRTETFPVTVPIDKGSKLTVLETGEEIPLYALWPNLVRTPTTPREGPDRSDRIRRQGGIRRIQRVRHARQRRTHGFRLAGTGSSMPGCWAPAPSYSSTTDG